MRLRMDTVRMICGGREEIIPRKKNVLSIIEEGDGRKRADNVGEQKDGGPCSQLFTSRVIARPISPLKGTALFSIIVRLYCISRTSLLYLLLCLHITPSLDPLADSLALGEWQDSHGIAEGHGEMLEEQQGTTKADNKNLIASNICNLGWATMISLSIIIRRWSFPVPLMPLRTILQSVPTQVCNSV